jgi:hypothetical protein
VTGHSEYKNVKQYFQHWGEVLSGAPMGRYDELS